jgi:hypothetical protein
LEHAPKHYLWRNEVDEVVEREFLASSEESKERD